MHPNDHVNRVAVFERHVIPTAMHVCCAGANRKRTAFRRCERFQAMHCTTESRCVRRRVEKRPHAPAWMPLHCPAGTGVFGGYARSDRSSSAYAALKPFASEELARAGAGRHCNRHRSSIALSRFAADAIAEDSQPDLTRPAVQSHSARTISKRSGRTKTLSS